VECHLCEEPYRAPFIKKSVETRARSLADAGLHARHRSRDKSSNNKTENELPL